MDVAGLKVFFASKEARELVAEVVSLELLAKELAERVKPIQDAVMAKAGIVYGAIPGVDNPTPKEAARIGKPILNMDDLWLSFNADNHAKVYDDYSKALNAAGTWPLVSPEQIVGGYCPLLVANHRLLVARAALAGRTMEVASPDLKGRHIAPDMVDNIVRLALGAVIGPR